MAAINGYSSNLSEALQNHYFTNAATPYQGTIYCALAQGPSAALALPDTEGGGGFECDGAGYTRVAILNDGTFFGAAITTAEDTATSNILNIQFPVATAAWASPIYGFVLCKTATPAVNFAAGDVIAGGELAASPVIIAIDTIPIFKPGDLVIHTVNQ